MTTQELQKLTKEEQQLISFLPAGAERHDHNANWQPCYMALAAMRTRVKLENWSIKPFYMARR